MSEIISALYDPEPTIAGHRLRPYNFNAKEKHDRVIRWLTEDDLVNDIEIAKAFFFIHAAPVDELVKVIRNKEAFFTASEKFFLCVTERSQMEEFCDWILSCRRLEEEMRVETIQKPKSGHKEETPPPN